jgi:hypothetical protein
MAQPREHVIAEGLISEGKPSEDGEGAGEKEEEILEPSTEEELPTKEQEEDVFGEKFEIPAFLRKVH